MPDLLALCSALPTRTLHAGDVLIETGDIAGSMYVLVSGTLTVGRDGTVFARADTPGAVFGEMAVALGRPASASVRAADDVTVHVIDEPHRFLTEQPGVALEVLRITASRLDNLTRYLVDVKQQLAGSAGHLGMVGDLLDTLVHHQAAPTRAGSARDPEGSGH